jgi:nucleotide-binding universal stress UspA family protein
MTHQLKTILIPIDGSPQADEAVQSLKAFSPSNRVLLLHCFAIPQLAYPGTGMSVGRNFSEAAEQALRKEGSRILERAASHLPAECGKVSQHLEMGDTASVILSMSQENSVDLILIGSRGLGAIQEHVLGSVSHRMVTHSPCPTLIAKSPLMPLNNILLPIEHPLDAEWAIEWLAQKPFQSTPHISVLHVIPFTQPVLPVGVLLPDAWKKELQAGGAHFVQDVTNTLRKLGYQADSLVEPGAPSSIIQDHITRLQPELVLIGTHQRSILNRFAHGSVSHATVHHAPCSVLLLKKPVE